MRCADGAGTARRVLGMTRVATESRVYVGQASLQGGIGRYARSFDLLEVSAEPGRRPGLKVLRAWRDEVPEAFVFSVVLPSRVSDLEGATDGAALFEQAVSVAEALRAAWWVLRTPPSVLPSARSLRRIGELAARLRGTGRSVAWDPRGLWAEDDLERAAEALGVHVVRDLSRDDPVPRGETEVYTRLRALGEGMRVGAGASERVADRLTYADRAFVIVEGAGAGRVRKALREAMGAPDDGDEQDLEDDDGDDAGRSEEE
jgi:uncharacterized protein YecE (DUF72 family)